MAVFLRDKFFLILGAICQGTPNSFRHGMSVVEACLLFNRFSTMIAMDILSAGAGGRLEPWGITPIRKK
ncbi:MAG: hypothetical protein V3T60_02040 [Candidatus Binatia bacterium]